LTQTTRAETLNVERNQLDQHQAAPASADLELVTAPEHIALLGPPKAD